MPQATPAGRSIARIQRLCCLGGGGQLVIPDILRELAKQVPSSIGPLFAPMDDRFETTNAYSEDPGWLATLPLYVQEFEERKPEREVAWSASETFRKNYPSPVGDFEERRLKVSRATFLKSAFYNEFFKPARIDRLLNVAIVGRARYLATLTVARAANDPQFSKREIRLLETIVPFIAHALMNRRPDGPYVDSDDRALVMVDESGTVQHASREARRLLLMARFPAGAPPRAGTAWGERLPDEVVRLCRRVAAWSEANPLPVPPVWRHLNEWGEFVFRVMPMEQDPGVAAPRLTGVSVERREPLRLKLLRRIGELPLSGREAELCLALLDGHSRAGVADRLGITDATAISYCRSLYAKLDVHNRMELVEKLQAM